MGVLRGVWDGVERDERGEKGMILRKGEGGLWGGLERIWERIDR